MEMMWYWGSGVEWWGWLLGSVGMLAFWAVVVWCVLYLLTNRTQRPNTDHQNPPDAEQILDERLARGEIETDEYRKLLAVLRDEDVHAYRSKTATNVS
jgi:putative membrane protein